MWFPGHCLLIAFQCWPLRLEGVTLVLIASVHGHCLSFTFSHLKTLERKLKSVKTIYLPASSRKRLLVCCCTLVSIPAMKESMYTFL